MTTIDDAKARAIAKERADWLVDAVAMATQNRQFLRGEPEADEVAIESILLNGEKAIRVAIDRALLAHTADYDALKGRLEEAVRLTGGAHRVVGSLDPVALGGAYPDVAALFNDLSAFLDREKEAGRG